MKPIFKLAASVTFIAFLASGAAMAKCALAEDSEHFHLGMTKHHHIYRVNSDRYCFLKLTDEEDPTFRVTGLFIEKDAKHGTLTAELPSPSPGNSFVYEANPEFKGEEIVLVYFETERNGKPSETLKSTWRITVQ